MKPSLLNQPLLNKSQINKGEINKGQLNKGEINQTRVNQCMVKQSSRMQDMNNVPADKNSTGWQASLLLNFIQATASNSVKKTARTVMGECSFYGPLRVQRPFYPEGNLAHIYILHPPGGVVGGDQLQLTLNVQNRSQVLCTTPGSGKFYLSAGEQATLQQTLRVASSASLEWLPQENILFSGARLQMRTTIELEKNATFIGWDISCLGRPASLERFTRGSFDSQLTFYVQNKCLLIENQRVFATAQLDALAGLRGHPLQASLLAYPCDQQHIDKVRNFLSNNENDHHNTASLIAVTLLDGLLVVRALGDNSEQMKEKLIKIWQLLRPLLLNRFVVLPRIWAT